MLSGSVEIKIEGLNRFRSMLDQNPPPPAVATCLKQWAARYRGFVQRRFDRMSKGGEWKALSPKTIARRRKGKTNAKGTKSGRVGKKRAKAMADAGGGNVAILRDTGLLFAALNPTFNSIGGLEQVDGFSITVGYGGPAKHTGKGGHISIADLAAIHDQGLGHVPKREIIVPPDEALKAQMAVDGDRALAKLIKESGS